MKSRSPAADCLTSGLVERPVAAWRSAGQQCRSRWDGLLQAQPLLRQFAQQVGFALRLLTARPPPCDLAAQTILRILKALANNEVDPSAT